MEKETIINLMEKIRDDNSFLYDCIDTAYIIDNVNEFIEDDFESFKDYLKETYIDSYEIIYYSNAIEFLKEYDSSLKDSLEIAIECGYSIESINSELLATLLFQQKANEELEELEG